MKKIILLLSIAFIGLSFCSTCLVRAQGVGINPAGNNPDPSAIFDVSSTTKGQLMPRMTTVQRDAIALPAQGLFIYNTDCNTINFWNGGAWIAVGNNTNISAPGSITGNTSPCQSATGVSYSISSVTNATSYSWTVPTGAVITSGQGSIGITINFGTNTGSICVVASNACGTSSPSCLAITFSSTPASPTAASNTPSQAQVTWNWNAVSGATGYKYSTTNNYSGAIDNGTNTSYTQTGLTCNNGYTLYVWAYNACGNSSATILTQTTAPCCCAWVTAGPWQYKTPIAITNNGSPLANYQVLITMNTSALVSGGKMRSDGGDIRITDEDKCTMLYFYTEQSTVNTGITRIWIKVPSVPAGNKTIYLYYGNSSATSQSDGPNTMIYFDGLEGVASGWNWTHSGGSGDFAGTTTAFSTEGTQSGYLFRDGADANHTERGFKSITINGQVNITFDIKFSNYLGDKNQVACFGKNYSPPNYTNLGLLLNENAIVAGSGSYNLECNITTTQPNGNNLGVWFDHIRVHAYASTEPTASIGTEQTACQ